MNFSEMHELLAVYVSAKVSNGEISERALARRAGISQPHLHQVLKRKRFLSLHSADLVMGALGVSVLDLIRDSQNSGYPR